MSRRLGRSEIGAIAFTAILIALIALVATDQFDAWFAMLLGAMVVSSIVFFTRAFPGSRFFLIAFANGLAVYATLFVAFVDANFAQLSNLATRCGFVLPFLAFLAGAWIRRERIRRIVLTEHLAGAEEVTRSAIWLVPVFAIGLLTFILPALELSPRASDVFFLTAMLAIAAIVFAVSADVSSFLIETGLLFEEFFDRIAGLVVPTFAFLTFYSVTVITFAAGYRVLDRLLASPNFAIGGIRRAITFPESLYFSIVTMATVGYGDIVPASDAARMLAAIQVVIGILLLLIGFSEIFSYTRERRRTRPDR